MAVSTFASGTQSSSVGTEHFVSSPDVAGDFVFYADLSAMQAADVVELRVYKMAKAGGTSRQLYYGRFEGAQIGDVIAQSLPVANALTNTNAVRFSIKQTFGTTRDFDWSVKNREDFTAAPADSAGVTTLLGKFTGITVLAQWLGLIAGKQVGNSTARTEVRATGAGSGTFDETTDSVEALRDSALTAAQVNAEADTALADAGVTSTRTAYLDNLNISGNVASSTEVTSIQNNTRVIRTVPVVIERPDSGTVTYRIELFLYDTVGNMEAPDSAPTIALVNQAGTDRSSRLDSTTMALVSTGRYRAIYTADVADTLEQLVWAFSVVEGAATRLYGNQSLIVDTTAVDFTAADRTKLELLATDFTTARAVKIDNLDATVSSRATPAQVKTQADAALSDVGVTLVRQAKLDNLPSVSIVHTLGKLWVLNEDGNPVATAASITALPAAEGAREVIPGYTMDRLLRLAAAASGGDFTGPTPGEAGTATLKEVGVGGATLVTAEVDEDGNRDISSIAS